MPNEFIVKNGLVVGGNVVTSGTITINGALAATQSWVTSQAYLTSANLSGYATQSYVTSALAALVDAAPAALDTLNELAAALGDDASFSTTITNSIASKLSLSGGTMTGQILFQTSSLNNGFRWDVNSDAAGITFKNTGDGDANSYFNFFTEDNANEYFKFSHNTWNIGSFDFMDVKNGVVRTNGDIYVNASQSGTRSAGTNELINGSRVWHAGDFSSTNISNWSTAYSWGNHASVGYITSSGSISGNAATATTFSTNRTNYKGTTDNAVAGQLMWKNYGNQHTIFDASQGTSPDGGSISNTNSQAAWSATYPTLMGWNGSQTYGVRVDSARIADTATIASGLTSMNISQFTNNSNYVAYGNYSWTSPVFGQYGIKSNLIDNVLYSAADRFEVFRNGVAWNTNSPFNLNYDSNADTIPANTSRTYSIILNTKNNPSYGIVYTEGNIYLSFYYVFIPGSVSGRVKDQNGVWRNIDSWTNVANNGSYAVWRGNIPSFNYMVEIEITINANSSNDVWFAQWEYVMGRPGQYELGIFNKAQDNSVWRSLYFLDSSNVARVTINSGGISANTVTSNNFNVSNAIYFGAGNNYLNWTNGRIYSNVGIETANNFYVSGNLVATQSWVQSQNYLTSYSETDTLATVTGRGASTSTNISVNTITIGTDATYGGVYRSVSFGYNGDGSNRIFAANNTNDGMYFAAATGQGFNFRPNGGTANLVVINSAGNLGIGITAPIEKLHVTGNAHVQAATDTVGGGGYYLGSSTSRNLAIRETATGNNFAFDTYNGTTSWVNRVTILNSNGNVGIGTTTPARKLVVNGETWINLTSDYFGGGTTVQISAGGTGAVGIQSNSLYLYPYSANSSTSLIYGYNGNASWNLTNGGGNSRFDFFSYGAGTQVMSLTSGGNVGIGTTSPSYKLDINGNSRTTGIHYVDTYLVTPYIYGGGPITMGNDVIIDSTSAWNASAAMLNVGGTGDGRIQVRHIYGKSDASAAADHLWIQYQNTGKHVQIGDSGGGNNLYVSGNIYMNGYLSGNLVATQSWVNSQGFLTSVSDIWVNTAGDTMTGTLTIQGGWASTILDGDNVVLRKPNYSAGGWARTLLNFQEYDGTSLFQIGGYGSNNVMTYGYLGSAYNTPTIKWYANKNVYFSGNILIDDAADNNRYQKGATFLNLRDPWNNLHLSTDSIGGNYIDANLHYWRPAGGASYWMTLTGGNLGIGTTSPSEKLHVSGRIMASGSGYTLNPTAPIFGQYSSTRGYVQVPSNGQFEIWTGGTSEIATFYNNQNAAFFGNVGIGITTPQKKLDVFGSAGILASFGSSISPGAFAGLHFGYSESASNNDSYKKSALVFERTDNHGQGGNASGKIHFLLNNIATASATSLSHSVMVIDTDSVATQGSARVGIGTTSPSTALTVNGVITATGGNSTNWNTAYGWGNHASAGYLTSETDTLASVTGRGATTSTNISVNNAKIGTDGTYSGYGSIGFGGNTNGYNRVFGNNGTSDGLFLASATGRGIYFRPNGGDIDRVTINAGGNVAINTSNFTYANGDNVSVITGAVPTANKLFIDGSIQLLNNTDAIIIGRSTSTFLTDEELGFGWGGGWYMIDGSYLRVRNNIPLYSTGSFYGSTFFDVNDSNYYGDFAGTSRFNNLYIEGGVASVYNSSGYSSAAIEVRERNFAGAQDDTFATAPRIGFHWGGRIASQIALASNGRINILNDPGTANEAFQAAIIYSSGYGDSTQWSTAYSWGNHASASYATTSYVTTQINNLINGAPGVLDTLDELAAALGDDSNFATTVTNSIAGKVSKAGDTMTGNINWDTQNTGLTWNMNTDGAYIKFFNTGDGDTNSRLEYSTSDNGDEYHRWVIAGVEKMNLKWGGLTVTDTIYASGGNSGNWNTAYGWGNHASAGYALNSSLANYLPLSGGVIGGGVTINGNLTVNGTITENSSLKLKENVETSEGNLEKVVNLRPVTYNKIGSQTTELGLIAEEVAEVYPEFVQYDENGEPIGVHYSRLTAALIGAVKELTNQVQELNKKING